MPTAWASCIGRRWSGPPGAEPPPTASDLGSAFQASTNSVMVLYGESLLTTMAPDSSMSLAIGVVWSSLAVDWLVYWAPTTPRPIIINNLPLPFSSTVRASPVVPEAPARLNTSMFSVAPTASITLAASRAVVSYPLPGVFGTMNRRPVMGSSAGAEAPGSARSAVAPHPVVSSTAATPRAAPSLSRLNIIIPSSRGLDGRGWWAEQTITGGRDDSAIANRAVSACGHDGHCGLNGRTGIAAATRFDATMTLAGVIGVIDPAAPLAQSRCRSCGGGATSIIFGRHWS